MGQVLVAAMLCVVYAAMVGFAAARVTARIWRTPAAAVSFAVIGVAFVGWIQFLVSWLAPAIGPVFAVLVFIASAVIAGTAPRTRSWLRHLGLVAWMLGFLLLYLGFQYLYLAPELDAFGLASYRFSYRPEPYTADNYLPMFMADRIQAGQTTHGFFLHWNGSDRPPLQAGLILAARAVFGGLGLTWDAVPFAVGVVAQLLWIPAVWALFRALGVGPRAATAGILLAGVTPTILLNSTYTWPKLLAASLVIVAMALLIIAIRGQMAAAWAAAAGALAFVLAMLAHGAAAFSLPAIAFLAIALLVIRGRPWRTVLAAVGTAAIAYLPWILYQRLADPPGDRLLKWHLAGVIEVDDRSVGRALVDTFSNTTLGEWVAGRLANLEVVLSPFVYTGFAGGGDGEIGAHRYHEYYETTAALGVSLLLLVGIVVAVVVQSLRGRPPALPGLLGMMALMLPCIAMWVLVIYLPGGTIVHQGSHVWLLVLIAGSGAWVATLRPWIAYAAVAVQAALLAWFYVEFFGHDVVRPSAIVVMAAGVAIIVGAGIAMDGFRRRRSPLRPVVPAVLPADGARR